MEENVNETAQNEQSKNQENVQNEQNKTQETETLIKNFDEKIKEMQGNFEKRLAEKDDIIRQLIINNGKNEPELTDDEQSCQNILKRINERRKR